MIYGKYKKKVIGSIYYPSKKNKVVGFRSTAPFALARLQEQAPGPEANFPSRAPGPRF